MATARKLLYLIPTLEIGGAEVLLSNVVGELRSQASWDVEFCTMQAGGALEPALRAAGVAIHSLELAHRFDPRGPARLSAFLHDRGYSLVHSHLFPADLALFLSRPPANLKCISTEHNVWNRRRQYRAGRLVDGPLYRRFDRIVCVSALVQQSLVEWLPGLQSQSRVIYNGVPIRPTSSPGKKHFDLLCLSGLQREEQKGIDVLLRAVPQMGDSVRTVAIAGSCRAEFQALSQRLGLADKVRFLGHVMEVSALMEESKLFVMPSRWEGLPIALLEAMERSMPIIATPVGGIPEVVEHRKTAVLIAPGDPGALAQAGAELLADESLAAQLGQSARERVTQQFSINNHVRQLRALYDELVS